MRLLVLLTCLLGAAGLWAGPPLDPPRPPAKAKGKTPPPVAVKEPTHADRDCELALAHMASVPESTRPYLQFFSFKDTPDSRLAEDSLLFLVAVNKVSTASGLVRPAVVAGSGGRLFVVDYRVPHWNRGALHSVAGRDKVFTEPNVEPYLAESLRRQAGLKQDSKHFHVEVVLPGPWFIREILESDRSATYYDLLYAYERFGGTVDRGPEPTRRGTSWPGGYWPPGSGVGMNVRGQTIGRPGEQVGQYYAPGSFSYVTREDEDTYQKELAAWKNKGGSYVAAKDFPATLDDWNKKWGVKAAEDYLKEQKLFAYKGAVIAGARSDPERGSYVAYQDRVITFLGVPGGRVAMRSYDSAKTAGDKNYANKPYEATIGDLKFDAGELLTTLPNGLQAALLINGEGKRVEVADSRIARNTLDPHDVTVRTQIGCITCHAPSFGVLVPTNNKLRETIGRANLLLVKDAEKAADIEAFLTGWDDLVDTWRTPYKAALARLTVCAAYPKGWDGKLLAARVLDFRDWYDAPVNLGQAAAELGYPRAAVVLACLHEGSIDAGNLALDSSVPRTVWDEDLAPRLALILSAFRQAEKPNEAFALTFPYLLRHSRAK